MSLNVRVITPDKIVWDADTEEIILPSSTGQLGILTDHAPLLTALDIGVMRLKTGTAWTSIVLMEGFAEVENNKVTVLCNGAEEATSIDAVEAQANLEKITLLVDEATTKKEKIEQVILQTVASHHPFSSLFSIRGSDFSDTDSLINGLRYA
jgi:F-type H+-transporting ATPase subunit epsilon